MYLGDLRNWTPLCGAAWGCLVAAGIVGVARSWQHQKEGSVKSKIGDRDIEAIEDNGDGGEPESESDVGHPTDRTPLVVGGALRKR
jgi:hypothetical protein